MRSPGRVLRSGLWSLASEFWALEGRLNVFLERIYHDIALVGEAGRRSSVLPCMVSMICYMKNS